MQADEAWQLSNKALMFWILESTGRKLCSDFFLFLKRVQNDFNQDFNFATEVGGGENRDFASVWF
jgi:hypothetical protein